MRNSIIVAILFLAATTALNGCATWEQMGACGAPPASAADTSGWMTYERCIDDYEREKRRQEQ